VNSGNERPATVPPGVTAAAAHRQLLDLARRRREEPQSLLARYAFERLLYRIGQSVHADAFEVDGMELRVAGGVETPSTATRTLSISSLKQVLREICRAGVDVPDGIEFRPASVRARSLATAGASAQIHFRVDAAIAETIVRLPFRLDVVAAHGSRPLPRDYPTLLDLPPPRLRIRPFDEAFAAEKVLDVMAPLNGEVRMLDLLAVWRASVELEFSGPALARELRDRFLARPAAPAPSAPARPLIADTPDTRSRWRRLTADALARRTVPELGRAVRQVEAFVLPPFDANVLGKPFDWSWRPPGPWRSAWAR
jgi:hypothetical protein